VLEGLSSFLSMRGLPPHGYCLLWQPSLVWSHVISDAIIGLAYLSIPLVLWRLLRVRRDIEFGWMVALFATFILACGATHLFRIYVLWVPAYGVEAVIKAVTAAASIGTALLLLPLFPKLVALPSPSQLQAANERLVIEARERERTAEMLRQSQKLEAVGRLTGGVAHDFNNLLQVVIGNIDRARRKVGTEVPAVDRALSQALSSAERAAELTAQLLAFARQQPLEPKEIALQEVVAAVGPLIQRAVGPGVAYTFEPGAEDWRVLADRNQLENALLNLAINARDAMPDGGALRIAIAPADHPGRVELSVEDTGIGMDAETLERATEPFFTTKPVGQGTGLGLSQVFGMVEQIGGSMTIESAPGEGARVRLLLPRANDAMAPA
jgi:signal transduction histidine kinase